MKIDLKAGSEVAAFRLDSFAVNPYFGMCIEAAISAFADALVPGREDVMSGIRMLGPRCLSSPLHSDNWEVEMRVRRIAIPSAKNMDVCDIGGVVGKAMIAKRGSGFELIEGEIVLQMLYHCSDDVPRRMKQS